MKENMPTLSDGNMKIGDCPNVSLTPIKTCRPNCLCAKKCYALKAYRMYPAVRECWDRNTKESYSPIEFCESITRQLQKKSPERFRWFVSGDAPSEEFMQEIMKVVALTPNTQHLMNTKRYEWAMALTSIPKNIVIRLSAWPGMELPKGAMKKFPIAWIVEKQEKRLKTARYCPGSRVGCKACGYICWYENDDVYWTLH
jgi:hypothetical protein